MSRVGRAAATLALLWLAACTTLQPAPETAPSQTLSGRLVVRVDGTDGAAPRSVSAAFDLHGTPRAGTLDLSTPLGSMLAQARWAPGSVVLATPRGERSFDDLDALTREVLGESLPVAALFDWLRGRPWPGAASAPAGATDAPGFEQLGWTVSLAAFEHGRLAARRERAPAVTLRAQLDRP